jgi:hypothetical protein
MSSLESFYALPIVRETRIGGVYVFRSMSPSHTGELLFRSGTCVRVLTRPDTRGRVQVQFKDGAKFNLGTNNLVGLSGAEKAAEEAREVIVNVQKIHGKALEAEFSLKAQIAELGTYERPATETAEVLGDLPY